MGINGISQSQTNQSYLLSNNKKQYMDNESLFNTNTTVQDTFTGSTQDGADDGKISFWSKVKNFGKGLISPITSMFSSVENFVLGAGMIAGGAALIAVTGGAAAPLLVAAGVATGAVQFVSGAYKASTAKTDAEAESAWQGIGAGTSITALSVLGAKSSLKAAGKDTTGTGYLKSAVKCFEEIPSSISKSMTNGRNFFTAKPAGTKPASGTKSQNTIANEEPVSHNQKPAQKENGSTVSNTETKPQTTPKTEQPAAPKPTSEPQTSISEPKPTAEPNVTPQEQSTAPTHLKSHGGINGLNPNIRHAVRYENGSLRTDAAAENYQKMKPVIEKLDKEFSQLAPTERDYMVYRGLTESPFDTFSKDLFKMINDVKPGDVIVLDEGYSYTSFTQRYAQGYSQELIGTNNQTAMCTIKLPKGSRVSRSCSDAQIATCPQPEAIMPRAAQYRVISKEVNGLHTNLELEYILPSE